MLVHYRIIKSSRIANSGRYFSGSLSRAAFLTTALLAAQCLPASAAPVLTESTTDLWQNATVTNTSALYPGNSGGSMFGGTNASPEATNTVFSDGLAQGFLNFVEWNTPSPVTLMSFVLHASHDQPPRDANQRGFRHFELYAKVGASFQSIFSYDVTQPLYGNNVSPLNGLLESNGQKNEMYLGVNLNPIVAQFFRVEFTQFGPPTCCESGVRIHELDGFNTFNTHFSAPDVVPIPAALPLFATGLGALGFIAYRRNRKRSA